MQPGLTHHTLSKLQGPPLKLACFLKSKQVSSGKQLNWRSLKKHLTTNYLEIPYDTHTINAYDNLHQGSNESTSTYLHRVQDILEHIHHTSDMTSISAMSTNDAKILTILRDGRLCNKLAKSKAKKWTTMSQILQDVADINLNLNLFILYSDKRISVQNNCLHHFTFVKRLLDLKILVKSTSKIMSF